MNILNNLIPNNSEKNNRGEKLPPPKKTFNFKTCKINTFNSLNEVEHFLNNFHHYFKYYKIFKILK